MNPTESQFGEPHEQMVATRDLIGHVDFDDLRTPVYESEHVTPVEGTTKGPKRVAAEAALLKEKLKEAQRPPRPKGKPLIRDIKEKGVQTPLLVRVGTKGKNMTLVQGHHRLAAAHELDPNGEVPVEFYRSSVT